MKKQLSSLILVGTVAAMVGCTTPTTTESSLMRYHAPKSIKRNSTSLTGLRYQSIRDAALSTGARAGLAWRAKQINLIVSRHDVHLDQIYNFNSMLLHNNVLPPVLIEGRNTMEQNSDDIIRISDRAYSIQAQARFVSTPPTWREYLKFNYKDPDMPDVSLLPRNESEREVWDRYIDEGWQAGITQADIIFAENLGRLKRDYEGMVRYRTLLAQNMVSLPFVAQVNLGITGGDSQMAINDRVLRITALPEFNTKGNEWSAQVTPDDR